jgi:hypothetical protein
MRKRNILRFDPSHAPIPRDQPEPIDWRVISDPRCSYSAIAREWNPGDMDRCKLCPKDHCQSAHSSTFCLLMVRGSISHEEGKFFDARKLSWPERKTKADDPGDHEPDNRLQILSL